MADVLDTTRRPRGRLVRKPSRYPYRVTVGLGLESSQRLVRIADRRDCSVMDLIREAVQEYLARQDRYERLLRA